MQNRSVNYDVLYNNGFQQVQDEILEECRACMDELYKEVEIFLGTIGGSWKQ